MINIKLLLSGVVFINPCIDVWARVDTRARAFSVPPQQVLLISKVLKIKFILFSFRRLDYLRLLLLLTF